MVVNVVAEPNIDGERLLTSHEVGLLLQVNPSSVNKWVKEGRISAFRTPGGHRRIRASDLVQFLDAHQMPVPGPLQRAMPTRLLIVDDDPAQLRALERLFKSKRQQIQASFASNGIDALVQLGALKPHIVILDVFMPELDGIEVCRTLKANPETAHIHVIMASARLSPAVEANALAAGASRCLRKPIDISTLLGDLAVRHGR